MRVIKFNRIELRKPFFDPHPEKSKTNNHSWRKGLFVVFKDNEKNDIYWMPKWSEVEFINEEKVRVEEINKQLAKENFYKKEEK